MKNLIQFITITCLLLTIVLGKGSHSKHTSVSSKKKASSTQIKCGGQEFAWLRSDFTKMTAQKIKTPAFCDNAGHEGDDTCCSPADYNRIQEHWKTCQSNANQSIYAHNVKNIMDKFGLILTEAKKKIRTYCSSKINH